MKVFLCSTYSDLVAERNAVLVAIGELEVQYKSMEFFGAKPDRPIDACLAEVEKCNVLVVIVGHKYGSIVPGTRASFSETEYQRGYKLGKPCLVYSRDSSVPVLPIHFEREPDKLRAFASFQAVLNERHTVATFRGPEDLANAVQKDLRETIELLEADQRRQKEASVKRSAFLTELETLALAAIENGVREALALAAVRQALNDLRVQSPSFSSRMGQTWSRFTNVLYGRPERNDPWVFFSYAHHDQQIVESVAIHLRRLRTRVWVDQQQLIPGDSLIGEIEQGLQRASALVFFASNASLQSGWARHELDFFMSKRASGEGGPPVIPVVLEDVELPALMRDILYIDMRSSDPGQVARRIAAVIHNVPHDEVRR